MLVVTNGKLGYLGAHSDGGVAIRDVGYDKGTLAHELVLDVGGDDAAAEAYARSKIGTPYDWGAIFDFVDFVLPLDLHQKDHLICSAFMTLAARKAGALPYRLACRAHEISPRDLLLVFSGRLAVG
jgi:cell wall-associated NlpC family hydrolase